MNTLIAENHITVTPQLFKESMKAVEDNSYKKSIQKLALILIGLYLIVAFWLVYSGNPLVFLLGESVFLASLLYWLFVMLPNTKYKNKYKSNFSKTNAPIKKVIYFYENHLQSSTVSESPYSISYKEITGYCETKNLYIITCTQNRVLLLSKAGFISGSFDILKSFLCL